MPVEIKELVIRAVVNDANVSSDCDEMARPTGTDGADSEAIVQECVRQVLDVLNRKRER